MMPLSRTMAHVNLLAIVMHPMVPFIKHTAMKRVNTV